MLLYGDFSSSFRFEQFLINYCNEKIQQYFIQQIMHQEQQIYQQEGLRWKTVQFNDNFKCLELIEKKSHGVLALLQEQCILPKGSDERFTSNLTRVMVTNEKLMLCGKVPKKVIIVTDRGLEINTNVQLLSLRIGLKSGAIIL